MSKAFIEIKDGDKVIALVDPGAIQAVSERVGFGGHTGSVVHLTQGDNIHFELSFDDLRQQIAARCADLRTDLMSGVYL